MRLTWLGKSCLIAGKGKNIVKNWVVVEEQNSGRKKRVGPEIAGKQPSRGASCWETLQGWLTGT